MCIGCIYIYIYIYTVVIGPFVIRDYGGGGGLIIKWPTLLNLLNQINFCFFFEKIKKIFNLK